MKRLARDGHWRSVGQKEWGGSGAKWSSAWWWSGWWSWWLTSPRPLDIFILVDGGDQKVWCVHLQMYGVIQNHRTLLDDDDGGGDGEGGGGGGDGGGGDGHCSNISLLLIGFCWDDQHRNLGVSMIWKYAVRLSSRRYFISIYVGFSTTIETIGVQLWDVLDYFCFLRRKKRWQ